MMSVVPRPTNLVPFDEHRAMRIYRRNLPHWRQEGCTYFVTFRLADSVPGRVRRQWEHEQSIWLRARGIVYDGRHGEWRKQLAGLSAEDRLCFEKHFNQQAQACLDRGLGECWLKRGDCATILRDEIMRGDGQCHHVGDFVIMPNHVHLLTTPVTGKKLEMILKGIKGKSAVACNRATGRSGPFWQEESYDHIVRHTEQLIFLRRYIAENPVRAGIQVAPGGMWRAAWMDEWLSPEKQN